MFAFVEDFEHEKSVCFSHFLQFFSRIAFIYMLLFDEIKCFVTFHLTTLFKIWKLASVRCLSLKFYKAFLLIKWQSIWKPPLYLANLNFHFA